MAGYIRSFGTAEAVKKASNVPTVPCYAHFQLITVDVHRITSFLCVLAAPYPHQAERTNMYNQRFIEIEGEQIPVTEEIYRAYKRPLWVEHKKEERAKRCRDEKGKRCNKDCKSCSKHREGSNLSLDKFSDDGFDFTDPVDVAEFVADKLILEQLTHAISELEPDERSLIEALYYKDRTEREYAAEIGISHQAVGKRKQKIIEKLRKYMDREK